MLSRYSSSELHQINQQNANRLPPATAVHGMAMYELKCAEEQERFFHATMFNVDQLRQTTAAQVSRTDSLERVVKACASHHDNERTISFTGVRKIQDAFTSFTPSDTDPKAVIKRSTWLANELDQEDIATEDQVAVTTVLTTNRIHEAKMELQQAVTHLRDDQLAVTNGLFELKERVSKLEDLVRVLTAQRTGAQDLPKMAQELNAITRYGKTVVLKIPKGQALVPLRVSRFLTPTLSNKAANSEPSSQPIVENGDVSTSTQATAEIITQPAKAKAQTTEKPLPPVPAAGAFPTSAPAVEPEQLEVAPPPSTLNMKPSSETPKDAPSCGTSNWDTSALSAVPPVHVAAETPRASDQPASILKSKGKGKAKKWTDPPIFQGSQVEAIGNNTKTLFSFHDDAGAASSARSPVSPVGRPISPVSPVSPVSPLRTETHEHRISEARFVSPIREVTNQMSATKPIEARQEPSTTTASNKKRLFGDAQLGRPGSKPVNENHTTSFNPTQANHMTPQAGIFSSADAMKNMMKSIAPKINYVTSTTSKVAAAATQERVVPRVAFKLIESSEFHRVPPLAPSGVISKTGDFGKIAKRSAIKKKVETSSTEQPASVPAQTADVASPLQSSTPSHQPAGQPPVSLSSSSTTKPQSSQSSVPTAGVASPSMSAAAPSFKPMRSCETTSSASMVPPTPNGSIFMASVMSKMTIEARALFLANASKVSSA